MAKSTDWQFSLPLKTEEELKLFVEKAFGVLIPNKQICPGHTTPWQAFADAYFAVSPVAIWKACVPGSSIVYTEFGARKVQDLVIGEKVWGIKNKKIVLGTVKDIWVTGEEEVYKISTQSGDLYCTENHRVLVHRKFPAPKSGRGDYHTVEWKDIFVPVSDIRIGGRYDGDLLVHPFGHDKRSSFPECGISIDTDFLELCGLIAGDGDVQKHKFSITHGEAANLLGELGTYGMSHTKGIPQWVYELPRELKIAFLRGYSDGNGIAKKDGIEWYSVNRMLLEDVKCLCMGIGLRTGRVRRTGKRGKFGERFVSRDGIYSLSCYAGDFIGAYDTKYSRQEKVEERDLSGNGEFVYQRVLSIEPCGKKPVFDLTVGNTDSFTVDGFITHNSRGFGGKSFLLALLGLTEAVTLKADVNILGGSGEQSSRVLDYTRNFWTHKNAPTGLLSGDVRRETRLTWGNKIMALMASQASVRGPHPQRLRMDEIDEMDVEILDAALGQPMAKTELVGGKTVITIPSQTILSSTHQYANGTMTEMLRRAMDMGWPIYEWCYRETMTPHGWLPEEEIEKKKKTVTAAMFSVEFDLQEPSPEARAILPEYLDLMFREELGKYRGRANEYIETEPPMFECRSCGKWFEIDQLAEGEICPECGGDTLIADYSTGADWARKRDWTVIATIRTDCDPYRIVAIERMQRMPWPVMADRLNDRLERFPGRATHDATGLGDVVSDLIDNSVEDFTLVGRKRDALLAEYIKAIEHQEIVSPFITTIYNEHKFAGVDDVFGSGHLPDSICALALAYRGRGGVYLG